MSRSRFPRILLAGLLVAGGCDRAARQAQTQGGTAATDSAAATPQKSAASESDLESVSQFVRDSTPPPAARLPEGHPAIDRQSPAAVAPPGASDAPSAAAAHGLNFEAPGAWRSQPPSSQMRVSQFLLPRAEGDNEDGELVVFYFGPQGAGSVEANLDRWRGMFTEADGKPVGDDAVRIDKRTVNGLAVTRLDVSGRYAPSAMPGMAATAPRDGYRMFAAVVEGPQGPLFLKATGPAATMAAHEQAFAQFLNSFRP